MNFEIQFNDITLLEANGEYEHVCSIMKKPSNKGVVEEIIVKEWMIEATVTLQNPFGFAQLNCHFYYAFGKTRLGIEPPLFTYRSLYLLSLMKFTA